MTLKENWQPRKDAGGADINNPPKGTGDCRKSTMSDNYKFLKAECTVCSWSRNYATFPSALEVVLIHPHPCDIVDYTSRSKAKMRVEIECFEEYGEGRWAQARYLARGVTDVYWTDDLTEALNFIRGEVLGYEGTINALECPAGCHPKNEEGDMYHERGCVNNPMGMMTAK